MSTSHSYHLSFWEEEAFFQSIDFLVIGAGIVGLHAALHLKQRSPKAHIVVVDRGSLPIGASTRNAGFACFGSMTELLDDLTTHSESEVWDLVDRRFRGLKRLRSHLGDAALRYEGLGGYELFRPEDEATYEKCLDHLNAFNRRLAAITGEKETFCRRDADLPKMGFRGVRHLIWNRLEGQIHTGWMMRNLIERVYRSGVLLLGGMGVQGIQSGTVVLNGGWRLQPRRILVATNGFARQLMPDIPVSPARNQVLITERIPGLPVKGTFHYDAGYVYFRHVGDRILLGGGRNQSADEETTDQFGFSDTIQAYLRKLLREVILPDRREVPIARWWSGILGVGERKKPLVRWVNDQTVIAVRLGGMGVAIGALLGEEAADLLMEC